MTEIVMPRLTDSMEEGTIIAWLKEDGDEVAVGDELVEIETDKASMVYEADAAGTLSISVPAGETREIGVPIATVGEPGETGGSSNGAPPAAEPETAAPEAGEAKADRPAAAADVGADGDAAAAREPEGRTAAVATADGGRIKASPLARRMAADTGVDLGGMRGSGPGGRIIKVDVEAAASGGQSAAPAAPAPAEGGRGETETVELTRTQRTIARRMAESKATVPHFYLRTEVRMDRAIAVRAAFKERGDGAPSLNDFVVKATARALREFPRANGSYRDDAFELHSRVNVGIAVATEDALIVPVVADADRRSLPEIAAESRRLAERVRSGEITPPELAGGTFTVSNLGMFGVRGFDAVINPGQAGILAVGEAVERPVAEDGELTVGRVMEMTLACDHRILYGADGARFLAAIKAGLEEPGLLA